MKQQDRARWKFHLFRRYYKSSVNKEVAEASCLGVRRQNKTVFKGGCKLAYQSCESAENLRCILPSPFASQLPSVELLFRGKHAVPRRVGEGMGSGI